MTDPDGSFEIMGLKIPMPPAQCSRPLAASGLEHWVDMFGYSHYARLPVNLAEFRALEAKCDPFDPMVQYPPVEMLRFRGDV